MKKIFCLVIFLSSLAILASCALFQNGGNWTTISQSTSSEPYYVLQARGNRFRILYEENSSARMNWYVNDYDPGLELKFQTLNRDEIKDLAGATSEQELSGQGYADFTLVYEASYKPQVELTYFKVHVELDDEGNVNPKRSSMTYQKKETRDD